MGKALDLKDKTFGYLKVLEKVENKGIYTQWKCKCECGNYKIVRTVDLIRGHTKTCGCWQDRMCEDISGKVFGMLKVVARSENKNNITHWLCQCSCGKELILPKYDITRKSVKVKSCGCYNKLTRENNKNYKGCGELSGRQFSVIRCRARKYHMEFTLTIEYLWKLFVEQNRKCAISGLEIKFHSAQNVYDGNASLDRIDSNKDYVEENVQWVHKDVNFMKQQFSQEYFFEMCEKIVNHQRKCGESLKETMLI